MNIDLFEHKLQIATADDVNTNGSFGYAVDVDGDYAVVTKRGHQQNFNSAYIFKKTGNNWAMHQDISGQPIGYDNFGLDAKIRNELVFISCRTYYSDSSQRASNEKGGIHVYKLNSTTGFFEPYNPANLDPTDKSKYGYDNAGNYNNEWGPYNFPAGPDARSNVIVSGPNYDGTNPEDFYFDAIPLNPNAEFSYFFDVFYENNVYTLIVGHPGTYDFYVFKHDMNNVSKGWLRWRYILGSPNQQKTGYDDVAIYGDYIFLSYTDPHSSESKKGKVYIYKYDDTQANFADKWQRQTTDLMASTRTEDERFGTSLAAYENYLIVGTENEKAYIYEKDENGDWLNTSEKVLTPITPESNSKFGIEVAIGKLYQEFYAIVGARQKTVNGQTNEGAFYLFKLVDGSWIQRNDDTDGEFVQASGDNPAATFSASISIKDNQIIVGAGGHQNNTTADNSTTTYSGAAYIFNLTDNTPTTLNLGLADISNNFLVKTALVKIADVDDYFKETINIKSFTDSELTNFFADLSNNTFTNSVKNHIAFKLVKIKPTISETVLNKLYISNDTTNKSFDIDDLKSVAKEVIFDASNNENIANGDLTPDAFSKSIFRGLKTISLKKNKEDFNKTTIEQVIKDISTTDDDDNIDNYLESIQLNLSLDLSGANLSNVDLSNVDLSGANLTGVDFTGTNLSNANLSNSDLSGANLNNTNLQQTTLVNVQNVKNTTGIATSYPYQLVEYEGQMRTLTQELTKGSISTMETKIGPFKQGETIIVNGVKIILGSGVTDAEIVASNPNTDGDSFNFVKKDNNIVGWGHKSLGGNVPYDISNVKLISNNKYSTSVLTIDGFVYAWGKPEYGGNLTQDLSGAINLFATEKAFCALKNDGTIHCWGDSNSGGTTPSLTNVINIYSNKNAFTALISDGTVHSWGLVNGTVPTTNNFIDVFSSNDGFTGIKSNGTIESWGSSIAAINTPPTDLSNVSIVFSNDNAFVALTSNGYLYNWGDANYGGDTDLTNLKDIVKVFNNNHAFACLDEEDKLFCWGNQEKGGKTPDISNNIANVFSTIDAFACLTKNNDLICWGNNSNGGSSPQITSILKNEPTISINMIGCAILKKDKTVVTWGYDDLTVEIKKNVHNLRNVKKIVHNDMAFCAVLDDGSVYVWGKDTWGGEYSDYVKTLKDILHVFPVYPGFIAIDTKNKLYSWGSGYAQNKPPANDEKIKYLIRNYYTATVITESDKLLEWGYTNSLNDSSITDVKRLYHGYNNMAVIKKDNSLVYWGYNSYSDERYLNDSSKGVRGPNSNTVDETLIQTKDISDVFIGEFATSVLKTDGSVYCWGRDGRYAGNFHHTTYGAKGGDSNTINPSLLSSGVKTIYVQSGYDGFFAHKNDNSLVCWGYEYNDPHHTTYGIRKATYINDPNIYPEEITSGIVKVYCSLHAQCALKTDGSVISWGHYVYGGNICHSSYGVTGPGVNTVTPSLLSSGVKKIILNAYSFVAIKDDNSVCAWGNNTYGGNINHHIYGARGTDSDAISSHLLKKKIKKIVMSRYSYCALMNDNTIVAWGYANSGGNIHDETYGSQAICGVDPTTISAIGVKNVFFSNDGFMAILNNNAIVTWGNNSENKYNFDSVKHLLHRIDYCDRILVNHPENFRLNLYDRFFQNELYDVEDISNNNIIVVNNNLNNIHNIYSTDKAFAAHTKNGNVHVWGDVNFGGYHSNLSDKNKVTNLMSTRGAFIGKNQDESHFIWGNNNYGGFGGPSSAFNMENRVQDMYSYCQSYRKSNLFALYGINKDTRKIIGNSFTGTNGAQVALSNDGTVSTWGNEALGASSANTQNTIDNLTNVKDIATGNDTVVALKSDGTLTAWNDDDITIADNSNFKKVVTGISGNIIGLKADGTVKYYNPDLGNWALESNIDTSHITDLSGITDVFAFDKTFAALDDKGALTIWGHLEPKSFKSLQTIPRITTLDNFDTFGTSISTYDDYIVIGSKYDGDSYIHIYKKNVDATGNENWEKIKDISSNSYGFTTSMNGSYLAVGDPYYGSGYVNIYKKELDENNNEDWVFKQKLDRGNDSCSAFGKSVYLHGDYLAVGSPNYRRDASVYIFKKENEVWNKKAKFTDNLDSAITNSSQFGSAVAISGIYLAVSCPQEWVPPPPGSSTNRTSSGYIYIYKRSGESWSFEKKFYSNDPLRNDELGYESIDISGDILVVGSRSKDSYTGAVYVFKKDHGGTDKWGQYQKITVNNSSYFGHKVVFGKHNEILISEKNNIYLYKRQSSTFSLKKTIAAASYPSIAFKDDYLIFSDWKTHSTSASISIYKNMFGEPTLLTNISSKASQLTSGVKSVTANSNVLIALKYDGTVVTLGNANNGGDISNTADQYKLYGGTADDIEEVFLNDKFAVALKRDRTCIYWGDISRNTDLFNSDISKFKNIKTVVFSKDVMIGLTYESKIVTLGEKSKGADYVHQLEKNVDKVIATSLNGFLALTTDGKLYSWGEDSNYDKVIDYLSGGTTTSVSGTSTTSSSGTTSSGTTSSGTTSNDTSSGDTSSGDTSSGGTTSGDTSSGGGYYY